MTPAFQMEWMDAPGKVRIADREFEFDRGDCEMIADGREGRAEAEWESGRTVAIYPVGAHGNEVQTRHGRDVTLPIHGD